MPPVHWITTFHNRVRDAEKTKRFRDFHILFASADRCFVRYKEKYYLILTNSGGYALEIQDIRRRIKKWPTYKGHKVDGYIILSRYSSLSPFLVDAPLPLSEMVGVVGRFFLQEKKLVASHLDEQMADLLKLAGIRKGQVEKFLKPNEPKAQREPRVFTTATPPATTNHTWLRSLRRGMKLDAYELDTRLGRGHSAEVWKGRLTRTISGVELTPGTVVAIKVYSASLLQGFQPLRIQREFTVAADLVHDNLARVYDLVLSPSRPFHTFMVMEYVDGPSLKLFIQRKQKLSPREIIAIAYQLFAALAELHSVGAVHRDVKAANIMLTGHDQAEPHIKLVDLGIVSLMADDRFTVGSAFLGSKHSAPFEQLTGRESDERTDIYGAGTVLYHCIQGQSMYQDAGPEGAIVEKMLSAPEILQLDSVADHTRKLAEFVNRCISVDPNNRPQTALECIDWLNNLNAA